jgi:hypothetical protein
MHLSMQRRSQFGRLRAQVEANMIGSLPALGFTDNFNINNVVGLEIQTGETDVVLERLVSRLAACVVHEGFTNAVLSCLAEDQYGAT